MLCVMRVLETSQRLEQCVGMSQRYDIREDGEGWTVFDLFTGEPVVIDMVPQTGLDIQDADQLAELLDHPAMTRTRTLRQ